MQNRNKITQLQGDDVMKISFEKNKLVYVIGILYTLNALIVVLSAWAVNLNRFGLDMTISRYIGLRRWTALLYVFVAASMATMAFIHVMKIRMNTVKKILYILAFVCVFGCAICPINEEWSIFSSNMHAIFAYTLMFSATITFIWMLIKPADLAQRIFSIVSIGYAVFFIVYFVIIKFDFLFNTLFIWENAFIYLFLVELLVEKSRE